MEKKVFKGEYLAPRVEVEEMGLQQHILSVSAKLDIEDNPFGDNNEEEW